jgi:undecaprenyl-diphosphatase
VLATIPAVIVGLFLKDRIEHLFGSLNLVYTMLLVTAVLMICSRYLQERELRLNWQRSLLIGCAQACAILPGLSRSGSTIFAGMALGVNREVVAKFSFIMSIPAILGAAVLQSGEFLHNPPTLDSLTNIAAGTVMSAISGYFAIVLLLDIVRRNRLQYFGYYCLVVALLGFSHQLLG